jgi:membrane protease YdiL (CAAX protease family)
MTQNTESGPTADMRKIPVWAFIVLAIVYPAILLALIRLLTPDLYVPYARFTSVEATWQALLLPYGTAVLFVVAAVTLLGWWRPVLRDHRPVRRWVRVVPIVMGVAVLGGSNYPELADKGAGFTLLLLLGALLVGCGEEAMYRGIGVTTFRVNGYSEGKVALWSSVLFGLSHAINFFSVGRLVFFQVLVAAAAGYFLYLIRRLGGGLLLPVIVHGFWDFGFFTGLLAGDGTVYAGIGLFALADVIIPVILLVRRHRIEPEEQAAGTPATA